MSAHLDDDHATYTGPILDLGRHHFDRMAGPVRIIGTWLLHSGEQCLVIVPALVSPVSGRVIPCIVRQSEAYLWTEEAGDPVYCVRRLFDMATVLPINEYNPKELRHLHRIIEDNLRDLIMMPPPPESDRVVVADGITIDRNTGKTLTQGEILSNV